MSLQNNSSTTVFDWHPTPYFGMANRSKFRIYLRSSRGDIIPQTFEGEIYLKHNEQFSIVIENNSNLKVKAQCFLSGQNIGVLILNPRSVEVLKRPIIGVDRCFQYCAFGTKNALQGKLCSSDPHSDEITVVIKPQKPMGSQDELHETETGNHATNKNRYATANTTHRSLQAVPDGVVSHRGGIVLGQNISHQKFKLAPFFETSGEYYYTLLLRTIKKSLTTNQIIPLCEMMEH